MEPAEKMRCILGWIAASALLVLAYSCRTEDVLVLQEIAPIPRVVVAARQAVTEYESVYSVFRIIEVTEVNGVQRFFLARIGADRTGVEVEAVGEIGDDAAFQRVIGNYKIVEMHGDFFRCEITELAYRIGSNAHARIKTGEKAKEPSS
jgi:hypothetical protein